MSLTPTIDEHSVCTFCGEAPSFDILLTPMPGADDEPTGFFEDNELDFRFCCVQAAEAYQAGWMIDDIYGMGDFEDIAERVTGERPREVCVENEPWAGRIHDHDVVRYGLTVKEIPQAVAKQAVRRHHRHNPPPAGDKFRFGIFQGLTLIGVCIVGRPVSRKYAEAHPDHLEVNRLCVWGDHRLRHNACTKGYAHAAKTARKLGYKGVVTYVLESELGTSLKAAGWQLDAARCGGGSWSRKDRPREDKAPTCKKARWVRTWK